MHDICGRVDGERVPLLHAGAVDGLAVVGESHPGYGLFLGDLGAFDQLKRELLIVEGDGENGTWRRPVCG